LAALLLLWYVIERDAHRAFLIAAIVLITIEALLALFDFKIIQGEISD
jgi:hypothetical protein